MFIGPGDMIMKKFTNADMLLGTFNIKSLIFTSCKVIQNKSITSLKQGTNTVNNDTCLPMLYTPSLFFRDTFEKLTFCLKIYHSEK